MRLTACALILGLAALAGCTTRESAPTPAPAAPPRAAAAASPAAAAPLTTLAPVPGSVAAVAGAPALGTQEGKWAGTTFDVVEFRRRGNTLTAKIRISNRGAENAEPDIHLNEAYLMDAAAGKKYEVLKDEKSEYIASLRTGWRDRWYETVKPGQATTIWMKFPAPPAEVKAVTLTVPGVPPFEELAIQD